MIYLEDGPNGTPALFDAPQRVVMAYDLADVPAALAHLDRARADGAWVAGYIAYEAGYAFEPRLFDLAPDLGGRPLLAFGIYDGPQDGRAVAASAAKAAGEVQVSVPVPAIEQQDYTRAFDTVMGYIAAGDCYQINLTFPMTAQLRRGTALGLFGAMAQRQKVGHGAYVDLGEGPILASRSPELFVRTSADGRIEARPMKGTAPRDPDPVQDAQLAEELRASAKGQAENLMIGDLLRNDIARISQVGSVKVPVLFGIETYATLHQMVSRVVGDLSGPPSMASLMAALFPCGSITGAPKIRAMEIIREVEPAPRAAYCGAIGWMGPDGASSFCVAIRTLQIDGQDITLNVGGGVVQDSTAAGEWEEALWKARYFTALAR
ncbi:MAG: aminodeoxychorismate synthase component I [Cypionkella sp.]|nr:aminodeoxychorismate synthase component I [Cypionkella sp.]